MLSLLGMSDFAFLHSPWSDSVVSITYQAHMLSCSGCGLEWRAKLEDSHFNT